MRVALVLGGVCVRGPVDHPAGIGEMVGEGLLHGWVHAGPGRDLGAGEGPGL